jgi:hypothetical protein
MKIKFHLLHIATILSILFFLYTGLIYIDQTYQAMVITNSKKLNNSNQIFSEKNEALDKHLKQLGFSDIVISHMTLPERNEFRRMNGKVVNEVNIYREVTSEKEKRISKKEYIQLLKRNAGSILPHTASLERVHLRLVYEGDRKFLMISEHHFDYSPHDLQPLGIEIQLRPEFIVQDQTAKQIWWTTPSFHPGKVKLGAKIMDTSSVISQPNDEFGFFNEEEKGIQSIFYSVPWNQPSMFEDIIGLHFYTVTNFEVPKDYTQVDAYIQGQNPPLSEQLQYEIRN